ncbi:hypothetical protein C8J57DRAFT_1231163 [Mycena rebaudengoi]|nr:hypothetical protein C8J57DRAFT_1231163 [Mycena rebaudengoi]
MGWTDNFRLASFSYPKWEMVSLNVDWTKPEQNGKLKQDTDEERGREAEDVSTMLLLDGTRIGGMQELWMNVVNSPGILHFDESTTGQRSFLKTRWRGSGDIAHAINLAGAYHARRGRKPAPAAPRSSRYAAEGRPRAPHPFRAHASLATSTPSAISRVWTLVLHCGARTAEPPTFARMGWSRTHRSARRGGPAWREHSVRDEIAEESKLEENEGGRGRITMTHERKRDNM